MNAINALIDGVYFFQCYCMLLNELDYDGKGIYYQSYVLLEANIAVKILPGKPESDRMSR